MRLLASLLLLSSANAYAGGEEVYNTVCKACHGDFGGEPVIPTARNLKTSAYKNPKGATVEGVMHVLEKGLPGTAMVAQLHVKAEDRKAVAEWIIAQRQTAAPEAAKAEDGTTPEADKAAEEAGETPAGDGDGAEAPVAPTPEVVKAEPISIEAAMAHELLKASGKGLTVYKGDHKLVPGLTPLGLSSKLPDPVAPEPTPDETEGEDEAEAAAGEKEAAPAE